MGGSWIQHRFNHYDCGQGISDLQKQAEEYYGHQEGYSGAINSCKHIELHRPKVEIKNEKALRAYIESRVEVLDTGYGEVIDLGITGYSIAKPVFNDYRGLPKWTQDQFKGKKGPAFLLQLLPYDSVLKAEGTVAELKRRGAALVLKEKFENDYIVVGRNISNPVLITGEGKMVKSTTQTSSATQLVLPYHDFIVYGWARS